MKRTPLVVANWKMNHGIADTIKFYTEFSRATLPENVEVVICPPFTSLYTLSVAIGESAGIMLGAQNCHYKANGAYTGEVSVEFLKELGCQFVIVGHSERRHIFHEDDKLISKKLGQALYQGLSPIFCVGEMENDRKAGKTFDIIGAQLEMGLHNCDKDQVAQIVVAYEPVWAIGTGNTATSDQAQEVHRFIRRWISDHFGTSYAAEVRILYGGSVKPDNINKLMAQPDIDGVLVGGASLKPKDFVEIISGCR